MFFVLFFVRSIWMSDFFSDFFVQFFVRSILKSDFFFLDFLSEIFECPIFFVRSFYPIHLSDILSDFSSDLFLIYLNVRYFLSDVFVHVCCTCKVAFLLIRPIVVFSPFSLRSPLFSSTRFYILFEQTINIIKSFAFSAGWILYISENVTFKKTFAFIQTLSLDDVKCGWMSRVTKIKLWIKAAEREIHLAVSSIKHRIREFNVVVMQNVKESVPKILLHVRNCCFAYWT